VTDDLARRLPPRSLLARLWENVCVGETIPFELAVRLGDAPDAWLARAWSAEEDPGTLLGIGLQFDGARAVAGWVDCFRSLSVAVPPACAAFWRLLTAYDGTAAARATLVSTRAAFGEPARLHNQPAYATQALYDLCEALDGDCNMSEWCFDSLRNARQYVGGSGAPRERNALRVFCADRMRTHLRPPTWREFTGTPC